MDRALYDGAIVELDKTTIRGSPRVYATEVDADTIKEAGLQGAELGKYGHTDLAGWAELKFSASLRTKAMSWEVVGVVNKDIGNGRGNYRRVGEV